MEATDMFRKYRGKNIENWQASHVSRAESALFDINRWLLIVTWEWLRSKMAKRALKRI